jgi:predicted dehydrogenase
VSRARVAVVGAGHLGNYHLIKLAADPLADLVGFVEPHPERRAEMATKHRAKGFASLAELAGLIDAVIVATPTPTHLEVVSQALEMGLHVLVEKPIALTSADGKKLVTLAQKCRRILQVGHSERWNPAVSAALAVADRPGYIVAERLGPFTGRSADVDVVLDLMIHDLDIVASLVPSPLVEARAIGVPILTHELDMAAARLAFADGTVAQLSAGRASLEPVRKVRLFTRERYLSIDCVAREVKSVRRLPPEPGSNWPQIAGEPVEVPAGDNLGLQDHDFLVCVLEGKKPRVDGVAGVRALELAEAVKAALTVPAYPD